VEAALTSAADEAASFAAASLAGSPGDFAVAAVLLAAVAVGVVEALVSEALASPRWQPAAANNSPAASASQPIERRFSKQENFIKVVPGSPYNQPFAADSAGRQSDAKA
jgi:hypothetical protein